MNLCGYARRGCQKLSRLCEDILSLEVHKYGINDLVLYIICICGMLPWSWLSLVLAKLGLGTHSAVSQCRRLEPSQLVPESVGLGE